jgi:ribonuclease HI
MEPWKNTRISVRPGQPSGRIVCDTSRRLAVRLISTPLGVRPNQERMRQDIEGPRKEVIAFTDGACEPNPGPGGIGVVLHYKGIRRELTKGFRLTTNNRMEIGAAILALEALKEPCSVLVYSDSRYLVDSMTNESVLKWAEANWKKSGGKRVPNSDLWLRLIELCRMHDVEFQWVEGHAGTPGNERADTLSYKALRRDDLEDDDGYLRARELESVAPTKITVEGQPCIKCSTPVVKRRPKRSPKQGQEYYFEFYLFCPQCHTMYMVEDAKRYFDADQKLNRSET